MARLHFSHRRFVFMAVRFAPIVPVVLLLACGSREFAKVIDPLPPPPRPAMGWSSWYGFATHISDPIIRQQAEIIISNGMRQAGYEYINVVDGWQGNRDSQGSLHPNSNFPDMKALGDYLHSRSFKFGIYTSIGRRSCGGFVGSYGHEAQDAQTFLDWGVDFVEYDLCSLDATDIVPALVAKMAMALRQNEKHPVVLSIVVLGVPWLWAPSLSVNMWRIAPDETGTYKNMLQIADVDAPLAPYAMKVGWNDPDLLLVGNGMTLDENRTQMTLWAMLAAPLISSTDVLHLSSPQLEILTNPDVIAIDQDPEVQQAARVSQGVVDVWRKKLADGWAIALINRKQQPATYVINPHNLALQGSQAYDVWTKQIVTLPYSVTVAAHGCVLLKTP